VEAYRQLGQLRSTAHFGLWLLRITRREALRLARRHGKALSLASARDLAVNSSRWPPDCRRTSTSSHGA